MWTMSLRLRQPGGMATLLRLLMTDKAQTLRSTKGVYWPIPSGYDPGQVIIENLVCRPCNQFGRHLIRFLGHSGFSKYVRYEPGCAICVPASPVSYSPAGALPRASATTPHSETSAQTPSRRTKPHCAPRKALPQRMPQPNAFMTRYCQEFVCRRRNCASTNGIRISK